MFTNFMIFLIPKKYYMFSACFNLNKDKALTNINFGYWTKYYPTMKSIKDFIIAEKSPEVVTNIVVLSICRLRKRKFRKLWSIMK